MSLSAVPRLPRELVHRPRLSARLEQHLPIVVLHAPMAYGKSVALAAWARETPREGVWMRVREGNGEPRTFVQQVAAELGDFRWLDEANPLLTAAETLSVDADAWGLLARGLRRIDAPFVLAIDDADRLSDETIAGLLRVLEEVPDLSLRVALRRASTFTEPGLALIVDTDVIGMRDLAMTASEARPFLRDEASTAAFIEAGAPPGLARLMALSADPTNGEDARPTVERAAESLLRVRSDGWDARMIAFLQSVAVADVVDIDLAIDLSGDPDAESLLDLAERHGLGSWSSAAPRGRAARFTFSPFLRIAAEASLRRDRPRAQVREVVRRVARWELAAGLPFPALRRSVEIGDWAQVDDVLRLHWNQLLAHGPRLWELFRGTPALTLRNHPLVAMVLALSANANGAHRLRALEYFALASYGARMQRKSAGPADRAMLRAIESAAHRVSGRPGSVPAAVEGYAAMLEMDLAERERLGRNEPTVYNQIGTSLFYGGRTDEALACFARSTASSDARGLSAGLQGLALTAGALAVSGRMHEAQDAADEAARRRWPDRWLTGYPGSFLQLARTLIATESLDADAADAALRTLDPHRATIEHWALLAHADAMILLLRGRSAEALALLEAVAGQQRARQATAALTTARLAHTRALVHLAAGDPLAAERAVAKVPDDARSAVTRARIAIAVDDPAGALRLLGSELADGISPRLDSEHLALTAAAVALGGDDTAAASLVSRLAARLREHGLVMPLAVVPTNGLLALRAHAAPEFTATIDRCIDASLIQPARRRPALTRREQAVAGQLVRSETVAEIADALVVSPNTVKSQLRSLYRKLGVSTRAEALRALAAHDDTAKPSTADRQP